MRVSGNTSCSGEIEYYCRSCDLVVIYDTKKASIDEKKSAQHTESLRKLRAQVAAEKAAALSQAKI
jgi:hypothetical protein